MNALGNFACIPEIINNIISNLGHNDQLTCLQVNLTWYGTATPHVFRWSVQYLQQETSPQLSRLYACLDAQEALQRNFGLAHDLKISNNEVFDLLYGSKALVNLVNFNYQAGGYIPHYAAKFLDIIQMNLGLRSLVFQRYPYFEGPFDKSMKRLAPILQSLVNLSHLEFKLWSYFSFADLKLLLDSLPKHSLKSLKMSVEVKDSYIPPKVDRMAIKKSSDIQQQNDSGTISTATSTWNLEVLDLVVAENSRRGEVPMLYRTLIFPIVRRCPNLKSLTVSALDKKDVTELSTILQDSCPAIEALRLYTHNTLTS
ncbi:hypothetical protein BG000_009197 [Podila horticola]|nr:hypothetical protein BG000_009197 [Podila horticola]